MKAVSFGHGGRSRPVLGAAVLAAVVLATTWWQLAPARAGATPRPAAGGNVVSAQVSSHRGQVIAGFGVAGAWWPAPLSHFPAAAQAELERLVFSPTGLDVSQYRYLIGSGGVGIPLAEHFRTAPSYLNADGTYNWDADPAGLQFLQMASQNHVPGLIVFANAAPAVLNPNGRSCGDILPASEVPAYAAFLTAVIGHLVTVDGIPVRYVSPINEPTTSQPTCPQEGMAVGPPQRAELIAALARDLAAAHLSVGIVADESVTTVDLLKNVGKWLPQTRSEVAVLSDHNYDFPTPAALSALNQLAMPHWATEICCHEPSGFGTGFDPTMGSGLWLSQTIYSDLAFGGYSAFDWWLAASPHIGCDPTKGASCLTARNRSGANDGLIYYDPNWSSDGNYSLYLTKRYWVMQAYSLYVRPGAVVHRVEGLPSTIDGISFVTGDQVVTVLTNLSDHSDRLRLDPPAGGWLPGASAVQTDPSESGQSLALSMPAGGKYLAVPLAGDSVTTVVAHSS
jgi:hypothetical protein